jgi:S-adenosylmethionine synthetase
MLALCARIGGGTVLAPFSIYLAGRAVTQVGDEILPIDEIAIEGSRAWLRANLHAPNAGHQVRVHNLVQPGSQDLQELISRRPHPEVLLSNDTSVGLG